MYTMAAIGATGVLFGFARYFSRPPPPTMTKEYQEASDAYLKVRQSRDLMMLARDAVANMRAHPGIKRRAHHRYLCRGLQGRLHGSKQASQEIDACISRYRRRNSAPRERPDTTAAVLSSLDRAASTPRCKTYPVLVLEKAFLSSSKPCKEEGPFLYIFPLIYVQRTSCTLTDLVPNLNPFP